MIILPPNAFMVLQDEAIVEEVKPSLIYIMEKPKELLEKPNTGEIVYTAEELNKYQGCKVVFRTNFADKIMIGAQEFLFFRDFNSSIYYVLDDKK